MSCCPITVYLHKNIISYICNLANCTGSYKMQQINKKQCFLCSQGPKGEAVGSITQPLPSSHLIFRAASESDGKRPPANHTIDIHVSTYFLK